MMPSAIRPILAAALAGTAGMGAVAAQDFDGRRIARLEARLADLEKQNAVLQQELIASNQREQDSAEALAKIKLRLEALGKNLIDGGDDRLVKAVSDFQILDHRVKQLEEAALRLTSSVHSYLTTAIAADPDARASMEVRLRELEIVLGLRGEPRRHVASGSLQNAKVVSIDPESGLVVLNVGEKKDARIGLVFNIKRGDELVGEAMVALTREDVSGLFVQKLENENNPIRFGDIASLKHD